MNYMNAVTEMKIYNGKNKTECEAKGDYEKRGSVPLMKIAPGDIDSVFKDVFQVAHQDFGNRMKNVLSRNFAGMEFSREDLSRRWMKLCMEEAEIYAKEEGLSEKDLKDISDFSSNALNMFIERKKNHGIFRYGTTIVDVQRKEDGGPC